MNKDGKYKTSKIVYIEIDHSRMTCLNQQHM